MKKILSKKNIINVVIGFMFFNLFINATIYNDVDASTKISESEKYENSILIADTSADEMWRSASNWFKGVDTNNNSDQAKKIVSEFSSIINVVGTTVIVIATIFLGVKYIIGSVESKTEVKESLITLLIACLIFFGCGILTGAVTVVKIIRISLEQYRSQTVYFILGMMTGSFYAIVMGPTTLKVPQAALGFGTFHILAAFLGVALVLGMQMVKERK